VPAFGMTSFQKSRISPPVFAQQGDTLCRKATVLGRQSDAFALKVTVSPAKVTVFGVFAQDTVRVVSFITKSAPT
jgi:hypothetical protein